MRPRGCSPSPSARKEKHEKRRISAEHERQDAAVRGRRPPAPEKGAEGHRPCDLQPLRAGAAAHAAAGRCAVERVPVVRRTAAPLLRRQCGHVGLHGGLHPQQRDGQQRQDHMDGHHRHPAGRGCAAVFLRQEQHRPQRPEKAGDPPHGGGPGLTAPAAGCGPGAGRSRPRRGLAGAVSPRKGRRLLGLQEHGSHLLPRRRGQVRRAAAPTGKGREVHLPRVLHHRRGPHVGQDPRGAGPQGR